MLAAGAATRFGAPKQRLFLPSVLEALRCSVVEDMVVVAGAHQIDARTAASSTAPNGSWARRVAALRAPRWWTSEAAVIVLADGPNSTQARSTALSRRGDAAAATARRHVRRREPLPPSAARPHAWDEVPDEGARALAVALVPCEDLTPPGDVD